MQDVYTACVEAGMDTFLTDEASRHDVTAWQRMAASTAYTYKPAKIMSDIHDQSGKAIAHRCTVSTGAELQVVQNHKCGSPPLPCACGRCCHPDVIDYEIVWLVTLRKNTKRACNLAWYSTWSEPRQHLHQSQHTKCCRDIYVQVTCTGAWFHNPINWLTTSARALQELAA